MKIVYRYILRELLGPMLFGVAAFVSILLAGRPLQDLMKLAGQGIQGALLLRLFLLSMPPLVVLTLPMSMLLATLLGFGRLSGDSEIVAMYAGGFSIYRAVIPVLILALAVMGLTLVLNEKVTPHSIEAANALRDRIEGQAKTQEEVELRLPQVERGKVMSLIRATRFNPSTGDMMNVTVERYKDGRPFQIVFAKRAHRTSEFHWTLFDGWYQDIGPEARNQIVSFDSSDIVLQQTLQAIRAEGKKATEMSMAELRQRIISLRRQGLFSQMPEYEVAYWNRWAMPFASVVFALIGLPLALRPQRTSGGLGLGLSIVIIFLYWVVWYYTGDLGTKQILPPFIASWLANFLGVGVGLTLLARAPK